MFSFTRSRSQSWLQVENSRSQSRPKTGWLRNPVWNDIIPTCGPLQAHYLRHAVHYIRHAVYFLRHAVHFLNQEGQDKQSTQPNLFFKRITLFMNWVHTFGPLHNKYGPLPNTNGLFPNKYSSFPKKLTNTCGPLPIWPSLQPISKFSFHFSPIFSFGLMLFRFMSPSPLCRSRPYVVQVNVLFGYTSYVLMWFVLMSFGLMSYSCIHRTR